MYSPRVPGQFKDMIKMEILQLNGNILSFNVVFCIYE